MKKNLLIAVMASLLCGSVGSAADIFVPDHSFENQPKYPATLSAPWVTDHGWAGEDGQKGFACLPDGKQGATTGSGADPELSIIYQDLSATYVGGTTYTLSAMAAARPTWTASGAFDAWTIALHDGATETELAATSEEFDLLDTDACPDAWQEISVSYTATAADHGQPIRIWFGAPGVHNYRFLFDDVKLKTLLPVTFIETEGMTRVREKGQTTDSFAIVLTEMPPGPVTVTVDPVTDDLFVNDNAEPNDPITLVFGTDDWDTPQAVTVKAFDDDEAEGQELATVAVILASDDPQFTGKTGMGVIVVDNDSPSVYIEESAGVTAVEEGGATDSYTVVLDFAPLADVTIAIDDTGDPNQVTVNGSETTETTTLTFTTANWDTPQTVTVAAIDDAEAETNPHGTELTHAPSSADPGYNALSIANIDVTVGENDCGAGPFKPTDMDQNCIVNLADLLLFAEKWVLCSIVVCP